MGNWGGGWKFVVTIDGPETGNFFAGGQRGVEVFFPERGQTFPNTPPGNKQLLP